MSLLNKRNVNRQNDIEAISSFEKLFPNFMKLKYEKPSQYILAFLNEYSTFHDKNIKRKIDINNLIFEYSISTLLIREKIFPFFMNAKVAFVPNINYDLLLYSTDRGPICLSAKTSIRKIYKQVDLESIALKYSYARSLCYLITLSNDDANMVNDKQSKGEVIGLDAAICATSIEFDYLIENIKKLTLKESPKVEVIKASHVITINKIKAVFPNF